MRYFLCVQLLLSLFVSNLFAQTSDIHWPVDEFLFPFNTAQFTVEGTITDSDGWAFLETTWPDSTTTIEVVTDEYSITHSMTDGSDLPMGTYVSRLIKSHHSTAQVIDTVRFYVGGPGNGPASGIDRPVNGTIFPSNTARILVSGTITWDDDWAILETEWPNSTVTNAIVAWGVGEVADKYIVEHFMTNGDELPSGTYKSRLISPDFQVLDTATFSVGNTSPGGNIITDIDKPLIGQSFDSNPQQISIEGTITQDVGMAVLETTWPNGEVSFELVLSSDTQFSEQYKFKLSLPGNVDLPLGTYYSKLFGVNGDFSMDLLDATEFKVVSGNSGGGGLATGGN